MKYYLIAGEASGDIIAAKIVESVLGLDSDADIRVWGGIHLSDKEVHIDQHIDQLNHMGFWEVISKMDRYNKLIHKAKSNIKDHNPDVVVFVDFSSFNMRVCKWAKKNGYKTVFISPPKTWASRSYRNRQLVKYIDEIIVLFPFEKHYFTSKDIKTNYFGHPLFEILPMKISTLQAKEYITIAPGSRTQEVSHILPTILSSLSPFKEEKYIISQAPNINKSLIAKIVHRYRDLSITISNEPLDQLLDKSKTALITSGTATIEACKMMVPQIVCYKTNKLNYALAKMIISTKYIALPNLIENDLVVKELIQNELNFSNIGIELRRLQNPEYRELTLTKYESINQKLSRPNCSINIAQTIIDTAK